ncbi:hypothetical protein N7539_006537 [Penicillium diatomitis]|uniref:Uncharacterized protein n=1 Tax=Penicillium diatomitis TaxID=2819901 RepID=A0A9W9X3C9_9EURO|nr:uncharacterized protein N7539_006537 [Penicillium diatomitis]KAJ5483091.1 hypothetical protein N7539_006537 [Penicillium diatomitis]
MWCCWYVKLARRDIQGGSRICLVTSATPRALVWTRESTVTPESSSPVQMGRPEAQTDRSWHRWLTAPKTLGKPSRNAQFTSQTALAGTRSQSLSSVASLVHAQSPGGRRREGRSS